MNSHLCNSTGTNKTEEFIQSVVSYWLSEMAQAPEARLQTGSKYGFALCPNCGIGESLFTIFAPLVLVYSLKLQKHPFEYWRGTARLIVARNLSPMY